MTSTDSLSEALAAAMKQHQVTPAELAQAADIPEAVLSHRLRHPGQLRITEWVRITRALGMDPTDLLL